MTTRSRKRSRRGKQRCKSGKRRYRDHEQAIDALMGARIVRKRELEENSNTNRLERRSYFCAGCKGFHLTSWESEGTKTSTDSSAPDPSPYLLDQFHRFCSYSSLRSRVLRRRLTSDGVSALEQRAPSTDQQSVPNVARALLLGSSRSYHERTLGIGMGLCLCLSGIRGVVTAAPPAPMRQVRQSMP